MSNIHKMMKKAQQMQKDMQQAQDDLAQQEIVYAGNGVEVTALGNNTIQSIKVEPDLINADDKEMLEDCLVVAVNGALDKVRAEMESRMSDITGGLNIPGLF